MKVDDDVEQFVRDTLHFAVKQQPAEFDQSLSRVSGERERQAALELLVAISLYVAIDICGERPSAQQVRELAVRVADAESWSSATPDDVEKFLTTALAGGRLIDELPANTVVVLAFVIAASLLASKPKAEGEWWFNYLDKVEAAIEVAGR
ncbi:hypothetical protein [Micromonospora sp. NBC_00421]|uniref:hypothetical protein n=1 Tax=Micromonospora sp. NBC_00421 TaxID=2975976 RepID=UPI002E23CC07